MQQQLLPLAAAAPHLYPLQTLQQQQQQLQLRNSKA
jgi:hypothetical protein